MQWFYVQRLSATPEGGTSAQYFGPFYGPPSSMVPFMGFGHHVLIYVNGVWTPISIPPGP